MQNFVKILFCFLVLTLFVILAPKEIQMELNTIIDDEPNLYIKDEGLCFFTLNNSVEEVNDKSNNTI
ncbi:MAG: hypothetical protein GYA87_06525, partial [Christensenellaceae bacterium]|nr:hypothetical protein [Christensenellaceae bacterium]